MYQMCCVQKKMLFLDHVKKSRFIKIYLKVVLLYLVLTGIILSRIIMFRILD